MVSCVRVKTNGVCARACVSLRSQQQTISKYFYKNKFVRREAKLPPTGNLKSGTILQVGGLVKMVL
jgi:hypothetical protein